MLLSKLPLVLGVKKPKGHTLIQFVCCSQVPDLLPLELFTGHCHGNLAKRFLSYKSGNIVPYPAFNVTVIAFDRIG